jgi:hypothetical protein
MTIANPITKRDLYRAANKERIYKTAKLWREKNKDKVREIARRTWLKNKHKHQEKYRKKSNEWYHAHREQVSKKRKENWVAISNQRKSLLLARRKIIFEHYGKCCNCCGLTDERFFTVDHVFSGKRNPIAKNINGKRVQRDPLALYKRIIEAGFPKDYQILCMNCNWAKGVFGICPHQKDRELKLG